MDRFNFSFEGRECDALIAMVAVEDPKPCRFCHRATTAFTYYTEEIRKNGFRVREGSEFRRIDAVLRQVYLPEGPVCGDPKCQKRKKERQLRNAERLNILL